MAKKSQDEISKSVIEFVAKRAPYYKEPITPDTSVLIDLKLSGDDAWDFLVEFIQAFNIDGKTLMFTDHFPGEGLSVAGMSAFLADFIRCRPPHRNYKPFTVADMIDAALTGSFEKR